MHMVKVDHARITPTRCVLCQEPNGPFVDTGVELRMYGRVYVCEPHVRDMGRLFDMVARYEHLSLATKLNEAHVRIQELEAEIASSKQPVTLTPEEMRTLVDQAVAAGRSVKGRKPGVPQKREPATAGRES